MEAHAESGGSQRKKRFYDVIEQMTIEWKKIDIFQTLK